MKKISLIALACTLVYTGCIVESKADVDTQINSLGLSTKLMTQLDTLDAQLISSNTESTRCNVVGSDGNSGIDDRFFLGELPESNITSHYNFRVNLSDSINSKGIATNIHALLDSTNFGLKLHVDSSYSNIPLSVLVEYKRVNSTVFSNDTFSVDSLDSKVLNFFTAPKTWTDSLNSSRNFSNSFIIKPREETAKIDGTDDTSIVPTSFTIDFSTELIKELQSKKTETLIYDFRITNLDPSSNHWLFSKNSPSHYPTVNLDSTVRGLVHQAECITNKNEKPFLTSMVNDTLNLKFEIEGQVTQENLIRRAWLLLDSSTYTSAVEDTIVENSNFYNTSRIYTADTVQYQESSLDTLSNSRYDLVSDKSDLSLPITAVIDHSVVDTSATIEKEIRFGLSTSAIDSKYYYNKLAWFQLNSETVPVKVVIERLIEEIE